ncbi:MAG: IPT/TIG domain-containing protein [Treponema sp.]|jgi:transglutaminase-like putative cysteine protease|nr:IPT/TIG domain-containing protein [Treponema sp.]
MRTVRKKNFSFFGGILFLFALLSSCGDEAPEIISIDPRIGLMGDVLTITGRGFGEERDESYITIAGTPPTSSSYISWEDSEITVRVPEFGEAGLIYVHRGGKKSNPALFANLLSLPEPVRGPEADYNPRINSITPASGPVGTLITISGSNFGSSREASGVFFAWNAESPIAAPAGSQAPDFIEVSETEFGYDYWSEREIRVRVPDGVISGNLEVRTPRGTSRPVFFDASGMINTKIYRDKRTYMLSYSADIIINLAYPPNTLYLWMPRPAVSASQRNVSVLARNIEPFVENYRGTSLFQLINASSGARWGADLSYLVEVYAVETAIRNTNTVRLNEPTPVGTVYLLPSDLIPSDEPAIKAQADAIIARERLPYVKAQRIYQWLISSVAIQVEALPGGALEALEEKEADSYRAALLFCALARAVEIPALPVSGVLVDRQMNTIKHCWAEFWLDGFGWIPLDPALGAGAAPEVFNLREDHGEYYFGSLDNQRVAFSRGETFLQPMAPRGRTVMRGREYSLQNIWEEAVGGMESYSSLWSDVTITGMYIQ